MRGLEFFLKIKSICLSPFIEVRMSAAFPVPGLGLIVAKKYIELHQGSLDITSDVGQGTTCVVTFKCDF